MSKAYKYEFREGTDPRDVRDTLVLACLAAEGVFGAARVQMDSRFSTNEGNRTVEVDASTAVGEVINLIFTAFIAKEFGPDAWTVARLVEEVRP